MESFFAHFQIYDANILLRILLSIVLGFGIGLERELTNKWAGLRTNILVSLGSCLFTILSLYGFSTAISLYPMGDPSRVAAQILTGIGFIGCGTVMRQGQTVSGLTTAATLWVVASIGMACGCGRLYLATVSTIVAIAVLVLIRLFEVKIMPKNLKNQRKIKLTLECETEKFSEINAKILSSFDEIIDYSKKKNESNICKIDLKICLKERNPIEYVNNKLRGIDDIQAATVKEIFD